MTDAATATTTDAAEAEQEAKREKRAKAFDAAVTTLAAVIDSYPVHMQEFALQRAVAEIAGDIGLDDPYEKLDEQPDLDQLLRDIRADLKRGDIEHALLLIHYETGDY